MQKTPFTVDGKPFFTLGGQVHNSSSQSREEMASAWPALKAICANTVAAPVCWELFEPEEGRFDYSQIDMLIDECRAHDIKLVVLWFGSWKNGASQYIPAWVKTDRKRFNFVQNIPGATLRNISPLCEETRKADARAFVKLMEHIKERDEKEKTILSVQVENEPGCMGCMRDFSDLGNAEFAKPVPEDLIDLMPSLGDDKPLKKDWVAQGSKTSGGWLEVFGVFSHEYFMAYHYASYINSVAKAGKAVYDIPMYVNVWIREISLMMPGKNYPSGGATTNCLDIWKLRTPDIEMIAPDIYQNDLRTCEHLWGSYAREDNALYVPESAGVTANAIHMFRAIADYGCVGYHNFAIDGILDADGNVRPYARDFADSMKSLSAALPLLNKYRGTGKIYAVAQEQYMSWKTYDFGDYIGLVKFFFDIPDSKGPTGVPAVRHMDKHHYVRDAASREQLISRGRGLIVYDEGTIYLVGSGYRLILIAKDDPAYMTSALRADEFFNTRHMEFISIEEGSLDENLNFTRERLRNGDEADYGVWVAPDVGVVKVVMDRQGIKK